MRTQFAQHMGKIQNNIFVDKEEDYEPTFKRVVDLKQLGRVLRDGKIIKLDNMAESAELEKTLG